MSTRLKAPLLLVLVFSSTIALTKSDEGTLEEVTVEGMDIVFKGYVSVVELIVTPRSPYVPEGDPVSWSVSLPTDAAEVSLKLGDGVWHKLTVTRSFSLGTKTGLQPGTHVLSVRYRNTYGMLSETVQRSVTVFERKLPVLYIETEAGLEGKEHVAARVKMDAPDDDFDVDWVNAEVNQRGISTLRESPKKSLSIETTRNIALLGMREDDDWVLLADWLDRTQMRNRLTFELYRGASTMSPYVTHAESRHVELMFNGNYSGSYLLAERVDRKLLGLQRWDDNDEYHSVIYKAAGSHSAFYPVNNPLYKFGWELKEPRDQAYWGPLNEINDLVCYATDEEFHASIFSLIDRSSLICQFLLVTVISSPDSLYRNFYLYGNASADEQRPLAVLPWDFDQAWGAYGRHEWGPDDGIAEGIWPFDDGKFARWSYLYVRLFEELAFREDVLHAYLELRETCWTTDVFCSMIDSYSEEIEDAVTREYLVWPRPILDQDEDDGSRTYRDSIPAPLVFDEEVLKLRNWIIERLDLLDVAALATLALLQA